MKKSNEGSLTPNDRRVLRVLRGEAGPMTAYQILDRLRDDGVRAPTTVYRALDRLVEAGRAHRLESISAFVCCDGHEHQDATAFAICDRCGGVTEFGDPAVFRPIEGWSRSSGFTVGSMTLELHGQCSACEGGR